MAVETYSPSADIVDVAEQQAIDRVAQNEGRITDIQTEHKKSLEELLMKKVHGTDGAAEFDDLPDISDSIREVDAMAKEREKRFRSGDQVAHLPGNVAGVEDDSDRSVRIDASLTSANAEEAQAKEVADHEYRHTQQASSEDAGAAPSTGDQEIDDMMALGSTEYREADAMDFAGDAHTSQQYHEDYKKPVNRVAVYLEQNGESGKELVQKAGVQGEIAEVREALMRIHLKNVIEDEIRRS